MTADESSRRGAATGSLESARTRPDVKDRGARPRSGGRRRGRGFLSGAVFGLVLAVGAAVMASLGAPPPDASPPDASTPDAPPEAGPASAAATATTEDDAAGRTVVEPAASPPAAAPPAAPSEAATATPALPPADEMTEPSTAAEPPPPAWRANAAAFTPPAPDASLVAVVLLGVEARDDGRSLAETVPAVWTLAVDPLAPGAPDIVEAARASGREALAAGAPFSPDRHAGVATAGAFTPAGAAEAGLLMLDMRAGEAPPIDHPGAPLLRADYVIGPGEGPAAAALAFHALQEAARRAAARGTAVVVASASDAALTALGRWAAVAEAIPAPLTAVAIRRAGD